MNYQKIFNRYEIKYLISKREHELIEEAFASRMQADKHGRSTVCNLYYDTHDRMLIRRSIEKPIYKEKLRMRSYGLASEDSTVFVEVKKKYKGLVYKRRADMSLGEAYNYLKYKEHPKESNQVIDEIDYFMSYYPEILPSMFISYERSAYCAKDNSDLRVTFDKNLLWRDTDLSLTRGIYGYSLLDGDSVLMEIKTSYAMPLWLTSLLTKNRIYKTSFSKYGKAYEAMMYKDLRGDISA